MKTHEKLRDTRYLEFFLHHGGIIETNGKGHTFHEKPKHYCLAMDFVT
jgi:hypothetical protein